MKKILSYHKLIRIISLVSFLVLAAAEFGDRSLLTGAVAAVTVILCYPLSYEQPGPSLFWSLAAVMVTLLADLLVSNDDLFLFIADMLLFGYLTYRTLRRFRRLRVLFGGKAPWYQVEDYARFFYVVTWLVCLTGLDLLARPGWLTWLAGALTSAIYVFLLYRARSGNLFFLRRKALRSLEAMVRGNLRTPPPDENADGTRLAALYNKAVRYLEEKRPFLDEGFSLVDLAGGVYSNKVFLSKAINYCSGRNFRQFINYYRVKYAVKLMERDPRLRVFEVASMCGFHNPVTFGVAFKVNMQETPGEFMQRLKTRVLESLSSRKEQEP